jgi:gluconate 2-dehydrogenase gamma chain
MAGQGMERREVLRIMSMAAVAAGYPGFSRWSFACGHAGGNATAAGAAETSAAAYQPQFFTPAEYATVERLTEMIIPTDETPGARESGVSEFIDFMVWSDDSVQYRFRTGLTWLDARSQQLYGKPFFAAASGMQTELLDRLAYKAKHRLGEEDGQSFFRLMREYTVMGFYTTKIGLEQINCPALEHFYSGSPACPHTNDRAHAQLPEPKS